MENIRASLRGAAEFKDLDDGALDILASTAKVEQFDAGEVILPQGVKGESVWLVLEGSVEVVQQKHSGKRVPLAVLGPGSIFGEISVLSNGLTTAEVSAKGRCRAVRLSGEDISRLSKSNLTAMARFAKSVVYRLSDSARKQ